MVFAGRETLAMTDIAIQENLNGKVVDGWKKLRMNNIV
jgi:hypothetical protein